MCPNAFGILARRLVSFVLAEPHRWEWTLQGFGMLRMYISPEMRMHVWDREFAVPNVCKIHDHPWTFESYVVEGRIVNCKYAVLSKGERTHRKQRIVCGPGGGATGEPSLVRLESAGVEKYERGEAYTMYGHEIHESVYEDGTVTLVTRRLGPEMEHAHVFVERDKEWVSAEPRPATREEVQIITARALQKMGASI
jgi:hypothetical protein